MARLPSYHKLKRGKRKPPYAAINLIRYLANYPKHKPMELTRADIFKQIGVSKSHLSRVLRDPELKPVIADVLAQVGVKIVRRGAGGRECFVWGVT